MGRMQIIHKSGSHFVASFWKCSISTYVNYSDIKFGRNSKTIFHLSDTLMLRCNYTVHSGAK